MTEEKKDVTEPTKGSGDYMKEYRAKCEAIFPARKKDELAEAKRTLAKGLAMTLPRELADNLSAVADFLESPDFKNFCYQAQRVCEVADATLVSIFGEPESESESESESDTEEEMRERAESV